MKRKPRPVDACAARHLFSPKILPPPLLAPETRQALTEEVARLFVDAALRRAALLREAGHER